MLFDGGRRSLALECLDVGRDRNRLDVFNVLISDTFAPGQKLLNRSIVSGSCVRVPDRDREKLVLRVSGPARVMRAGVGKESAATTASSESDIALKCYTKGAPFGQS